MTLFGTVQSWILVAIALVMVAAREGERIRSLFRRKVVEAVETAPPLTLERAAEALEQTKVQADYQAIMGLLDQEARELSQVKLALVLAPHGGVNGHPNELQKKREQIEARMRVLLEARVSIEDKTPLDPPAVSDIVVARKRLHTGK